MDLLTNYFIALITTGAVHLSLAIFILLKGIKNRINQTYALYSASIAIWAIFEAFGITSHDSNAALLLWRINHMGVIFIPIGFVHFVYCTTNISDWRRKLIPISYALGFIFAITNCTKLIILEVVPKFSFRYFINPGALYYAFFTIWLLWIVYGLFELFKAYFKASGAKQNQLKYFCWSMLIAYIGGVPNFFPTFNIQIPYLMPYGTYAIPAYAFFTVYAIARYRLMDINVALTRTVIFVFVYIPVLVIPFGLAGWAKPWLISRFGENWSWLPMLILLALATAGPFAYLYLQRRTEKVLRRDQFHHHAIIMTAARNISLIRDIDKVLKLLAMVLTKTLGITSASIYLLDRAKKQFCLRVTRGSKKSELTIDSGNSLIKYMQGVRKTLVYEELRREYEDRRDIFIKEIRDTMIKINADLLVPSFVEDALVGFLALGSKKSGEAYTIEDINVLTSLANQSALAIENAQFLKEREDMQGKLREVETLTTIRDLLGSFNHEIYNLLTPVSGTLQGINMGNYEKKPEKLKSDVDRSIAITFFIKTYLGWVREYVESGDKIAAYQLSELVNGGISYSKDKLEKQNIKTEINVDPKIFIVGYQSLALIFRHLIIHSIYGYGMEDGGTINISARVLEDGVTIEIIQIDTGDDLTKYIESGSTMGGKKFAEKGKLGGVSYFIAQAVVSKHKGIFKVEPTGGKGTKFNIRLPIDVNKISA